MSLDSVSIATALRRDELIPDLFPSTFTPSMTLSIVWPNGKEALLGNDLTRADTLVEPSISFAPIDASAASADATYTVVMTDPDSPSRADPIFKEVWHWIITGVKFSAEGSTRNLVAPYRPPGPAPGTGSHRYTFLLFQEPEPLTVPVGATEHKTERKDREHWSAIQFGQRYGLKLVGANFFQAKSME